MIRTSLLAAILVATLPAHHASAQTYKFTKFSYAKKTETSLHDINAKGTILGGVFSATTAVRQCFTLVGKTTALLNDPKAPASSTECWGISASGIIVGDYVTAKGVYVGYIYSKKKFTDIKPPGTTHTAVYGVNDAGVAVGYYIDSSSNQHGFSFDGTTYTTIDIKNGNTTQAFGINNAGQYSVSTVLADGNEHSYVFTGKKKMELVFKGMPQVAAHHFNNKGQICATLIDSSNALHGGVYDSVTQKYYQIDVPKAALTVADGISDKQTIVGRYQLDTTDNKSLGFIAKGKL